MEERESGSSEANVSSETRKDREGSSYRRFFLNHSFALSLSLRLNSNTSFVRPGTTTWN